MSEKNLMANSPKGDAFQLSLANLATSALGGDQEIQSAVVWTEADGVYIRPVAGTATTSHFKLPASGMISLPYENLNEISVHNASGDTAIVYVIWRGR